MKIQLLHSLWIDGTAVDAGETIEVAKTLATELIGTGRAVATPAVPSAPESESTPATPAAP